MTKPRSTNRGNSDLFSNATDAFAGSLHADAALASWGTIRPGGSKLLIAQLDVNWRQHVLHLYEIGSAIHYLIAGRVQGQWALARAMARRDIGRQFDATYAGGPSETTPRLCCTLSDRAGNVTVGPATWELARVQLLAMGVLLESGEISLRGQVAGQYAGLSIAKSR
jgi:hypothetical protein